MDQMGQNVSNPAIVVEDNPSPKSAASQVSSPEVSNHEESRAIPSPERFQPQTPIPTDSLELSSSPFKPPPSAQPPRPFDKVQLLDDEETVDFDEFDLNDFTQEEVQSYNAMAEPGQRLQDAVSPQKMQELMQNASIQSRTWIPPTTPSIPKQVAIFVRKHPFLTQVMGAFTKSQRRQFERDVYDYAEALGLDHAASKKQVVKARGFCGEEDYDSDNSALHEETDDSSHILKRLSVVSEREPEVMPSIENAQTGQAIDKSGLKPSPKKSPYFTASSAVTKPKEKRKREREPSISPGLKEKITLLKDAGHSKTKENTTSGASTEAREAKAARKASKKARKAGEQSNAADRRESVGGLEPRTEVEARENYSKSNQLDPHTYGSALDQTEADKAETAKEKAAFVEKLRTDVRYNYEKLVDSYEHGLPSNERQDMKDDLKFPKKRRDNIEVTQKRVKKSKRKKHGEVVGSDDSKVEKAKMKEDF